MKTTLTIAVLLTLASCGKDTKKVYIQGTQGPAGSDGQSCYAEQVTGGVNVICGDNVSFLPNGIDGEDGQDGTFTGTINLVEVCPSIRPNAYMETLLELDGVYMAYLAHNQWKQQRLVKLPEGAVFQTTDGREVNFKIDAGRVICL